MQGAFEKIIERLEERLKFYENRFDEMSGTDRDVEDWGSIKSYRDAIEIVNQVAEEFNQSLANNSQSLTNGGWILIENEVPTDDRFVLLSFENFSVPQIGRYHADEDGGVFCLGDEEVPLVSYGLFVNAWMELPKCYREE